jgi:formylmethanofuran dehydrogenase subunit E
MADDEYQTLTPVGVARTPYETTDDAPHQGFADDAEATIELFDQYADALAGVEDVVRLTVVYWADSADRSSLQGDDGVGAFARRTPNRPNPLSICTCMVLDVDGHRLRVRGLDAVDGSPVVDLKPALQGER